MNRGSVKKNVMKPEQSIEQQCTQNRKPDATIESWFTMDRFDMTLFISH